MSNLNTRFGKLEHETDGEPVSVVVEGEETNLGGLKREANVQGQTVVELETEVKGPLRRAAMEKLVAEDDDSPRASAADVKVEGSSQTVRDVILEKTDTLKDIFATDCDLQAQALITHCLKVLNGAEAGDGGDANDERGFMLSIIKDLAPRDAVERMLAVQMVTTHIASIRSARWLAHCENLDQAQAHYAGYNKLIRSFAAQMEALRKHRTGGKQTVTVQHVNVEDGGQAIVGNVETGGRGSHGK